jgi:NADH:ubiquinone oxidoreductase subunit 2 (subunit N)
MLIFMFSMAGIPFFIGFFAKFAVLLSLNGLAVAGFGLFPDALMLVCTTTLMRSL